MFALPNLIKFSSGEWEFKDGSIVSIPIELRDNYRIEQYKKITGSGWGVFRIQLRIFFKVSADWRAGHFEEPLDFGVVRSSAAARGPDDADARV